MPNTAYRLDQSVFVPSFLPILNHLMVGTRWDRMGSVLLERAHDLACAGCIRPSSLTATCRLPSFIKREPVSNGITVCRWHILDWNGIPYRMLVRVYWTDLVQVVVDPGVREFKWSSYQITSLTSLNLLGDVAKIPPNFNPRNPSFYIMLFIHLFYLLIPYPPNIRVVIALLVNKLWMSFS